MILMCRIICGVSPTFVRFYMDTHCLHAQSSHDYAGQLNLPRIPPPPYRDPFLWRMGLSSYPAWYSSVPSKTYRAHRGHDFIPANLCKALPVILRPSANIQPSPFALLNLSGDRIEYFTSPSVPDDLSWFPCLKESAVTINANSISGINFLIIG